VRPMGQAALGTRSEIKNLNSFRYLERAIQYEVQRQIELIEDGGKVVQETRLYDSDRNETRSMRSKEDADDYRYFPDPDLPPLCIDPDWIDRVKKTMPELPAHKRARLVGELGLNDYDAAQITMDRATSTYFEQVTGILPKDQAKLAANWVLGELSAALNRDDVLIGQCPVPAPALATLISRIADGTISNKLAREVFNSMWSGEGDADAIIEARGLRQINDAGAISAMIDTVIAANPDIVDEFRRGKQKAFNSLVGQVMKAAKGKANPQQVNDLLKQKLG